MSAADLLFQSIPSLSRQLHEKKLSPVELAEASLSRLETLGPNYNAVVTLMRDAALDEARAAERELKAGRSRGVLHGIPYGVKDLLATKRAPTTWGAEPYRGQQFDFDATVVERLHEAGAVLVAKLSMVELAGGMGYNQADAAFNGPGLSPWNTKFWSGGSSSGPGASVSAGLVSFAIGSETSGSILTPSSYCGVTGLRPTYGRVSRHGAMALSWTLDKLGPMARSAEDAAIVLAAIAGQDPLDASTVPHPFAWRTPAPAPTRKWRIAVPRGCIEKVQPAVRDNFEAAMKTLAPHFEVTRDVDFPDLPWGPAVGTIVGAEGASAFRDLLESGDVAKLKCPSDHVGGYSSLLVPAVDYLHAMRLRGSMRTAMREFYRKYDAIATPGRATVALPAEGKFEDAYPGVSGGPPVIPAGNLTGLPAIALPSGFGENGLPTSIAFMGPAFSEAMLAQIGIAWQSASDWHTRRPPGTT
ncbi:MAG TPA: amidase [Candidatus Acidoferrales bacterium]|nr:amidase [Candidatus Acidoferrales bacterium]